MNKIYTIALLLASITLSAQIKMGDNAPNVGISSALELESTNKALLITRVSSTASIATPVNGMLIYDISQKCFKGFTNNSWSGCLFGKGINGGTGQRLALGGGDIDYDTFYYIEDDGSVKVQGRGFEGQHGNGANTDTPAGSTTPSMVVGFNSSSPAVSVVANARLAAFLKSDGTVWVTGDAGGGFISGTNGALGQNSTTPTQTNVPLQVKGPGGVGFLTNVIYLDTGFKNFFAVKNDGTLWSWGADDPESGELGLNSTTGTAQLSPKQVVGAGGTGFLTNVKMVSSSKSDTGYSDQNGDERYHTCVVTYDGHALCWGNNTWGMLGDTHTTNPNVGNIPNPSPSYVVSPDGSGRLANVKLVATQFDNSSASTVAVLNDGTVWAWGLNLYGQLGQNSTTLPAQISKPIQVKGPGGVGFFTDVVDIKGTDRGYIALKSDGTVWAWGRNQDNSLGLGTTGADYLVPTQVKGVNGVGFLTGIKTIHAGPRSAGAIGLDGTVYAWGSGNLNTFAPITGVTDRQYPTVMTNF